MPIKLFAIPNLRNGKVLICLTKYKVSEFKFVIENLVRMPPTVWANHHPTVSVCDGLPVPSSACSA